MPGIHIFGQQNSMMVLNVQPDKEYDLMEVRERFEVPYVEITTKAQGMAYYAMIEVEAKRRAKLAIYQYERLRKWKWYNQRPPVLDVSAAQYDLDDFSSSSQKLFTAVDAGSNIDKLGRVAYVIKLWFVVPKQRVEVIKPDPTDPDVENGMVNTHNIKEFTPLPVATKES